MTDKAKPFLTSGRVVYGSPTNTWTAPWFAMVADSLGKTSAADLDAAVQRLASVDSTDVGRNHNRPQNTARAMADRWDAAQCPATWTRRNLPADLFEVTP